MKLKDYEYFRTDNGALFNGDSLKVLSDMESESIQCCITSPPYWGLRDYGVKGQLGLEKTPEQYVLKMVEIFREVRRVLRNNGTLWMNLGDTYCANVGIGFKPDGGRQRGTLGNTNPFKHPTKPKNLVGIPWRVAFALQSDGWYLRQDIIWAKPNPMPESVTDRCTKSHEYIFLMSKSSQYYYDNEAIREAAAYDGRKDTMMKGSDKYKNGVVPGKKEHTVAARGHQRWDWVDGKAVRNKRSVWTIPTKPYKEAHFATFPPALILPCILAGTKENDVILDPFAGSGTVWLMCEKHNRKSINIELSEEYCKLTKKRIENETRQLKLF